MKMLTKKIKALWNDESGQGATEYILLIVILVVAVMAFGPKLMEAVKGKAADVSGKISGFTGE